jgi:hypothetical protein
MYANAGLVAVAFAENGSGNEKLYTPPDDHFHMRATEIFFAIQSFLTHHWAATFARSAAQMPTVLTTLSYANL